MKDFITTLVPRLVRWHKSIIEKFQTALKLSDYQMLWIGFIEGLGVGLLIAYFF